MAVGISVGVAFGRVVNSLVNDVLMPPIGHLVGEVNFSNLYINLSRTRYASLVEAKKAGAATINFLIVALVVFFIVKQINRFKK